MKRKIFIGSSQEGVKIAEQINNKINEKCNDWLECEPWDGKYVFELNKGTLDCLIKASRKYDYGIFVASDDDISIKRQQESITMRDNVLFEMGLFLGSLGLNRTFLVTHNKVVLPSDFDGVTQIRYTPENIGTVINTLIDNLNKTKNSYCLKPIASVALALGYFESYVSEISEKLYKENKEYKLEICIPENLENINNHIIVYSTNHPSRHKYEERPIVFQYDESLRFWDIPTTLQTLNSLIDKIISTTEIGINKEKEEMKNYELRNFVGALEILIAKNPICQINTSVIYI